MLEVFRDLEIKGLGKNLDRFVVDLDKCLPENWKRDRASEKKVTGFGSLGYQIAYRVKSNKTHPSANLFLWRKDDGTLVVSNIVPEKIGQLTYTQYNKCVEEFSDVATPTAKALGLKIKMSNSHLDIFDELDSKARKALEAFEQSANRSSRHPLDDQRWRNFLILAYKGTTSLTSELLARWFIEERKWEETRSRELASEYDFSIELLKDFDEK